MARIVPAIIGNRSPERTRGVLYQLEDVLDDQHIIFQNALPNDAILVGCPGRGWAVIQVYHDVKVIDFKQGKVWASEAEHDSPQEDIKDVQAKLDELGIKDFVRHVFLINSVLPNHLDLDGEFCFEWCAHVWEGAFGFPVLFTDPYENSLYVTDLSVGTIGGVLKQLSPGASAYAEGAVTQSQLRWRLRGRSAPWLKKSEESIFEKDDFELGPWPGDDEDLEKALGEFINKSDESVSSEDEEPDVLSQISELVAAERKRVRAVEDDLWESAPDVAFSRRSNILNQMGLVDDHITFVTRLENLLRDKQ
ncbi:hypothetical protein [Ruegeria atlantica]|uniref:hypothetical protein n=1 Tax=Ruegeria atlantica TaxID=81569 RepID=UPI0024958C1D|nr:hypothetical protein [Ruegeria atlantica]